MTDDTATPTRTTTVQVHRVFIKATPEAIWTAITSPEWNGRYGYGSPSQFDLRPGGEFKVFATEEMKAYGDTPDVIIDGEVLEVDPPRRLVQTYRTRWDAEAEAEGYTTLTYELEPRGETTRLTVTHDLTGAPRSFELVNGDIEPFGGGWPEIISDLKTLLETGATMRG